MSRFFRDAGDSSSSSSSDSEGEDKITTTRTAKKPMHMDFSDSDEDVKRVSKSRKDAKYDELHEYTDKLNESVGEADWSQIRFTFDNIIKFYNKMPKSVRDLGTPAFFLRALVRLEDKIEILKMDKEAQKSLSKPDVKAFNTLKTRFSKSVSEYQIDISNYRENPVLSDLSASSDSESEDEHNSASSGSESGSSYSSRSSNSDSDSDSDFNSDSNSNSGSDSDDSVDWGSSSESDESSSSDDEGNGNGGGADDGPRWGAAYFLKKTSATGGSAHDKKANKKIDNKALKLSKQQTQQQQQQEGGSGGETGEDNKQTTSTFVKQAVILFEDEASATLTMVLEKTREYYSMRGKKNVNTSDQILIFNRLLKIASDNNLGAALIIKLTCYIITMRFDIKKLLVSNGENVMPPALFVSSLGDLHTILTLATQHSVILSRKIENDDEIYTESEDSVDVAPKSDTPPIKLQLCQLNVNVAAIIDRLDNEYYKISKEYDNIDQEHLLHLKNELSVMALLHRVKQYIQSHRSHYATTDLCEITMRFITHMYYKSELLLTETFKAMASLLIDSETIAADNSIEPDIHGQPPVFVALDKQNVSDYLVGLCKYIYTHDESSRLRTRAILSQVYYCALHNEYNQARDLLLMSQLQHNVHHADIDTQILYNRTMVQLGICAFRKGLFYESFTSLTDICSSNRLKEFLGQGVTVKYGDRYTAASGNNPDQDNIDKTRLFPYQFHIKIELIEFVFLASAMLLEVPNIAANPFNIKRKIISKIFRKTLDISNRQTFGGHLEITREYLVVAAKSLLKGDWLACYNILKDLPIWSSLSTDPVALETTKAQFKTKIQVEALRSFLFGHSQAYTSLTLTSLSTRFDLSEKSIHSIVSKMIIKEELSASWDQPTSTVILHNAELTKLQHLAVQFAEKGTHIAETNDRLSEIKLTPFSYNYSSNTQNQSQGHFPSQNQKALKPHTGSKRISAPRFGHKKQIKSNTSSNISTDRV